MYERKSCLYIPLLPPRRRGSVNVHHQSRVTFFSYICTAFHRTIGRQCGGFNISQYHRLSSLSHCIKAYHVLLMVDTFASCFYVVSCSILCQIIDELPIELLKRLLLRCLVPTRTRYSVHYVAYK